MNKKPIIFLIFKILGFIGVAMFVFGIIQLVSGFGEFEDNSFVIWMFMMPFGLFLGSMGIVIGFRPEITKQSIKANKYFQDGNKEELKEIMSTAAKINSEAVTITAQAVQEGLKETMYCKYCGQKIDVDSQFCKHCGQKL